MANRLASSFTLICEGQQVMAQELANWSNLNARNSKPYIAEAASFIKEWLNAKSTIQVQTSGSTGKPKQTLLLKDKMVASAEKTNAFFELTSDKTALLALSSNYIAGKMMLVRAFIGGYKLILVEPSSSPLKQLNKPVDFAPLVPMQVQASLNHLSKVKTVLIGGAPIPSNLEQTLLNHSNTSFWQSYGMTETISHIAVKPINAETKHYTCLTGITVSTTPENTLVIHAPYLQIEPFITTDVVELRSNETFIWKGRLDFTINSGGVKLQPEEIEKKLSTNIKTPFFISKEPDELLGERAILIIEQAEQVLKKEHRQAIDELPKFEQPKRVYFSKKLILTPSGKIKREASYLTRERN